MAQKSIKTDLFGKSLLTRKVSSFEFSERFYPPFFKTPPHTHDNALFCLVLRGRYTETYGRARRECSPRTALFHASDDPHAEHFHECGGHSFIVEIDRGWIDRLRDEFRFPDVTSDFRNGLVPMLGARLYDEFCRFDEASPLVIEGLMLEIAGETARSVIRSQNAKPVWLLRTERLLAERFAEKLTLAEIAAFAGVHPVHLAQSFRKFHRTTVGGYVRGLRFEKARELLISTSRPISEIALACGFTDQSHFSRRFRSEFGVTPNSFRGSAS